MDDIFAIDILFFAAIAGFLIYRLYTILGEKHGAEPNKDNIVPFQTKQKAQKADKKPDLKVKTSNAKLVSVYKADPEFVEGQFIEGAQKAFEIIIHAFAEGDKKTLNNLLGPNLYKSFSKAIEDRTKDGNRLLQEIEKVKAASIEEVDVKGKDIFLTVHFESQQIIALYDKDDQLLQGNPDDADTHHDLWTFYRSTKSKSPIWQLVATRSQD